MTGKIKGVRIAASPSLVPVFQLLDNGDKVFKGYQTPSGEWCDEQGNLLGEITFNISPPDPEDVENTGLEPEEVLKDVEGGES